jgi:hypothetical protein
MAKATQDIQKSNLKKQAEHPLDGNSDGVEVTFDSNARIYNVKFPYDRVLVGNIHEVEGVGFNRDTGGWQVPLNQYDALSTTLKKMRAESVRSSGDRADIMNRAEQTARALMQENGVNAAISPRISDYHAIDKPLLGKIINVNSRFAAQINGFGRKDGAAFVSIHDLMDLDRSIIKGDDVAITYDPKGRGKVAERGKSLVEKLDESLGERVDGVTVLEQDGKYIITFEYNPAMQHCLQRIAGVEFNRNERVWEVDVDKKGFVARAINDMRREFVEARADYAAINKIACEKVDDPQINVAFVKDGWSYTGRVLAMNDRYVLQHEGRNRMVIHQVSVLNGDLTVGNSVKITYQKGYGQVHDRGMVKGQEHGR